MPVVRRDREVSTAPLPGVRKGAASSAIAEGAGVEIAKANKADAIAGLGSTVARAGVRTYAEIAEESRRRADSVAILNAERRLAEWENKRLYDPATGALQKRGKDAMGLPEELRAEYTTLTGEIEKELATDRQREAFTRVKTSRGMGLDLTIQRHVFGEMNRYEGEELKAMVENAQSAAVANALDPDRVARELDRAIGAIRTHAPRLGLGPQAIEKQVAAVTSATHRGVIDRLLANDLDTKAAVYFEEVKPQIYGDDLIRVEKAIDEGSLRGDSQRKADAIIAAGGTFAEQRDRAKAIDDAKLRDAVEQRIEHNQIIAERAEREANEATLTNAFNIVDRSHDVRSIPPGIWSNLPGNAKASLRSYAEHLARGVPVKTDLAAYYSLMEDAAKNPEKFVTTNLLEFRGKLDEPEFKQIADLQLRLRTGAGEEADKVLNGFRTNTEIWAGILNDAGLKKDSAEAYQLHKEIDRRVDQWQADKGKPATNEEVQAIADNLIGVVVLNPGGWVNIFPGGQPFSAVTKRAHEITIADIPAAQRSVVEERLKAAGITLTTDAVIDTWLRAKRRAGEIK